MGNDFLISISTGDVIIDGLGLERRYSSRFRCGSRVMHDPEDHLDLFDGNSRLAAGAVKERSPLIIVKNAAVPLLVFLLPLHVAGSWSWWSRWRDRSPGGIVRQRSEQRAERNLYALALSLAIPLAEECRGSNRWQAASVIFVGSFLVAAAVETACGDASVFIG